MSDANHDNNRPPPGHFDAPDFDAPISLFYDSLGARVFKKVTGKSGDGFKTWSEVKAALYQFGTGETGNVKKIADKGLDAVGFFSSSEEIIAVPMLVLADRGREAQEAATKMGWWSSYDRTADAKTRALIAKLLSL